MTRRVRFEVGVTPCRFLIDDQEVASASISSKLLELAGYKIREGDEIEITDPEYVSRIVAGIGFDSALAQSLDDLAADREEEDEDIYSPITVDTKVSLNGRQCLALVEPFFVWPVWGVVEAICEVRLWGWLYGAWTTGLLYGGGLALFPYNAEEEYLSWESKSDVATLSAAIVELCGYVNSDRLVPDCPTCAKHDEEQEWGIDITTFVDLSDEHRSQLLDGLWYPCDEHEGLELEALGARWKRVDGKWSLKTS